METNALEIKGVSKSFGASKVLVDINLTLKKGEVHALMGENGAGKSTLIKIISGVHRADEGEMYIDGKRLNFQSPFEEETAGLFGIKVLWIKTSVYAISGMLAATAGVIGASRLGIGDPNAGVG